MTIPGLGGQQPPPQNASPAGQLVPGVQPGVTAAFVQLRAGNTIINKSGIFTYSSTPAAGKLIASQAPGAGTDSFGNNYLTGIATYSSLFAMQLVLGGVQFYLGSLSAGWGSAVAAVAIDSGSDLLLTANGSIFANGVLIS